MASHLLKFDGIEFEVRVWRQPNGLIGSGAYEHVEGEALEDLPDIPNEKILVTAYQRILESDYGAVKE